MKYDTKLLKERLRSLRKDRKNSYKENINNPLYEKYVCCETQEKLAEALNIERRTISSWERGSTIPSLQNLISLCNLLDCNIEYFLTDEGKPYIDSIEKSSYFTHVDPVILNTARTDDNYADCLNFFMQPDNCRELFDKITLLTWKQFWINKNLSELRPSPLKVIEKAFQRLYACTDFKKICKDQYKEYLVEYFPEENINFKDIFTDSEYKNFNKNIKNVPSVDKYSYFIDYIAKLTFQPFMDKKIAEIQKQAVSNKFIELISLYLSEL